MSDPTFDSLGATFVVNLRGGSITGTILGISDSVTMPDRFAGYVDFFFSTPVSLSPGTPYYFQPSLVSGDATWTIRSYNAYGYAGGTAYNNGVAAPAFDLWFREGVIVPEPTMATLFALGLSVMALRRKKF